MPLSGRSSAGLSVRGQNFLRADGSPPPYVSPEVGHQFFNHSVATYGTAITAAHRQITSASYIGLNPEIAKSYVINPTNQGQRAAIAQRESMMFDPRNSPSRSQFNAAYTDPIQVFAAPSTWQNQQSTGRRLTQPSLKAVSPFSRLPIPTRMPWDL